MIYTCNYNVQRVRKAQWTPSCLQGLFPSWQSRSFSVSSAVAVCGLVCLLLTCCCCSVQTGEVASPEAENNIFDLFLKNVLKSSTDIGTWVKFQTDLEKKQLNGNKLGLDLVPLCFPWGLARLVEALQRAAELADGAWALQFLADYGMHWSPWRWIQCNSLIMENFT